MMKVSKRLTTVAIDYPVLFGSFSNNLLFVSNRPPTQGNILYKYYKKETKNHPPLSVCSEYSITNKNIVRPDWVYCSIVKKQKASNKDCEL